MEVCSGLKAALQICSKAETFVPFLVDIAECFKEASAERRESISKTALATLGMDPDDEKTAKLAQRVTKLGE